MGWVGLNFFLPTMVDWVKKSPQPNPCTPLVLYYQTKTPISFCYRRELNHRYLIQLLETLPIDYRNEWLMTYGLPKERVATPMLTSF